MTARCDLAVTRLSGEDSSMATILEPGDVQGYGERQTPAVST